MKSRTALVVLFLFGATTAGALEAGFLGPGPVVTRGGWTLSLRADAFDGPLDPGVNDFGTPGPVTRSLLDYPVVVLNGPGKRRWEYSTVYNQSWASAVAWLRLEADWDGDGRPEVVGRFHPGYRLGAGIMPSGFVSIIDRLLLPGPAGWKGVIEVGRVEGDETGGVIQGVSLALVPGKEPQPIRWSWSDNEAGEPGLREVMFAVTRLNWNSGNPIETKRVEARTSVRTSSDQPDSPDPGWPRVTLNDDRVNLREGTAQSYPSLGLLSRGTVLFVTGMDSEPGVSGTLRSPWLRVEPVSGPLAGKVGWVFAHFCTPAF